MRFAILLGILLIATPLVLRASTLDPWPDAASYEAVGKLAASPVSSLIESIPLQLLLVIAAATLLFIIAYADASEGFIILFVTSPAFIIAHTTVNANIIGTILIALGSALLLRKQYWAAVFVPLCFVIGTNTGILASLVFIVLAIMRGMPFVALGVSFFALVSSTAIAFLSPSHGIGVVHPGTVWTDVLIGGSGGITVFLLALGILGLVLQYKETREGITFLPLALIIIAPLFEGGSIIVAGTLAYTGSFAWQYLVSREWKFEELGSITLVLIACSLLFTTIVTIRERATIDEDRVELRAFIRQGLPEEAVIATENRIAGVLIYEGFSTGTPQLPSDPSFIASALREQGYQYIITRETRPPYEHFPLVFLTDSETSYRVYAVPVR